MVPRVCPISVTAAAPFVGLDSPALLTPAEARQLALCLLRAATQAELDAEPESSLVTRPRVRRNRRNGPGLGQPAP